MSENTHLLIVDDDQEIRNLLAEFLTQYNYTVSTAGDGTAMFAQLAENKIDLIILDLMLPGDDGLTLCRKLRQDSNIAIIMLTAIGAETDRIIGLEVGADDYLAKPFNPRELLARVKAILRRTGDESSKSSVDNKLRFEDWQINLATRELTSPDNLTISLTAGEYDLLQAFLDNPQRVLSRDQLLDLTKNRQAGPFDRSIDVQISRLRHKIETDPKKPKKIKTVRGGGYLFTPNVEQGCTT